MKAILAIIDIIAIKAKKKQKSPLQASVPESLNQIPIRINPAIPQERPPASNLFRPAAIDLNDRCLLAVVRRTVDEFTLRTGHKTTAPELDAVGCARRILFMTNAVNSNDRQTVSDCMTALNRDPRFSLS